MRRPALYLERTMHFIWALITVATGVSAFRWGWILGEACKGQS